MHWLYCEWNISNFELVQNRFSHHRKIKCNNRDERNAKQKIFLILQGKNLVENVGYVPMDKMLH